MGCGGSKQVIVSEFLGTRITLRSPKKDVEQTVRKESDYDEDEIYGRKTHYEVLAAQRLHNSDITKTLEDRWLNNHFRDSRTSHHSSTKMKRRRLSHVTTSDERSIKSGRDTIVETESCPNTLLPAIADTPEYEQNVAHTFTILHFNDVYDLTERMQEPVGGAARFSSLLRKRMVEELERTGEKPLILFSGDCLNPSLLSCATKGIHMVDVFNRLEVDVAVFGNHDFDFGIDHATECMEQMKSVWLISNVEDRITQSNLAGGQSTHIITRKSGLKIGLLGLVEEEWLDTLSTIDKTELIYTDYVQCAKNKCKELKEQGAQFIIALTHMRWPNDLRLAQEVWDVDIILGGHDHEYGVKEAEACLIVKSGCDFRNFTAIDLFVASDKAVDVRLTRYDITGNTSVDNVMKGIVSEFMDLLENSFDESIGVIGTDLNGKYALMRTQETILGNLVADIVAAATRAEVVLINSGSFRSDAIHQQGIFRLKDLMTILPIADTVVTVLISGAQFLEALENGVSQYPKHEGRFPQISGACFGFDPHAPPGKRVVRETVRIGGRPIKLDVYYHMATKAYLARGKDGFTSIANCKLLNDPDASPLLSTLVRNHLTNVHQLLEFEKEMKCKVSISEDGRTVSCNRDEVDISQAFRMSEFKQMGGRESSGQPINLRHTYGHVPHFIAQDRNCELGMVKNDIDEKIVGIRKADRNHDAKNATLLRERVDKPHLVKWQITPVLEARIFHCEHFS